MEECRKKHPYLFLIIIIGIIVFIYFCVVVLLVLDIHPWSNFGTALFLIVYNLIFILLIWSMVQTIRTDPGRVPLQWVPLFLVRVLDCRIPPGSTASFAMSTNHNVRTTAHPAVDACSTWTTTGIAAFTQPLDQHLHRLPQPKVFPADAVLHHSDDPHHLHRLPLLHRSLHQQVRKRKLRHYYHIAGHLSSCHSGYGHFCYHFPFPQVPP